MPKSNELQDEFHKFVRKLLDLNSEFRKEYHDSLKDRSPMDIVSAFGSIHVGLGQRTGKTTWIKNFATPNDLVITTCPPEHINLMYDFCKATIRNYSDVNDEIHSIRFGKIIFDDADFIPNKNDALKHLVKDSLQTVLYFH